MENRTDRTWPLPNQPWVMRMTWSELLFAHWPIEPDEVARLLPNGVTLDTRDGKAWVGVVPFLMSNIAPRLCPPIPGLSRFLELNVRTYVTVNSKPGVWFFSLDAASRVAVRVASSLPVVKPPETQMIRGLIWLEACAIYPSRSPVVNIESLLAETRSNRTHQSTPVRAF